MNEPLTRVLDGPSDGAYEDTVALLQEEIARLEDELRARDESIAIHHEPPDHDHADNTLGQRIDSLTAELSGREETIAFLMEQTRHFEEAESAGRAELEQLHHWVEEVERRVGSRDNSDDHLRHERDDERRKVDSERRVVETERQTWAIQRQNLEKEVERLRAVLSEIAHQPQGADRAVIDALTRENHELRATCNELAHAAVVASEVESLRAQLLATQAERDEANQRLRQNRDDLERLRIEHEAEIAAVRKQQVHESLVRPDEPASLAGTSPPRAAPNPREADERIRALRQHLQEIQEQEERDRTNRKLSARLSRLWRLTGPS